MRRESVEDPPQTVYPILEPGQLWTSPPEAELKQSAVAEVFLRCLLVQHPAVPGPVSRHKTKSECDTCHMSGLLVPALVARVASRVMPF